MLDEKMVKKIWKKMAKDEKLLKDFLKEPKILKEKFKLSDKEVKEIEVLIKKPITIKKILTTMKEQDIYYRGEVWPPIQLPWLKMLRKGKLKK